MADSKNYLTYKGLQEYDSKIKEHIEEAVRTTLPSVTPDDQGKFLRVSSDGLWAAETIPNAEEAEF